VTEQKCRQGVMMTEKRDYERKLVGGVKNRVALVREEMAKNRRKRANEGHLRP
jgi:hypothetical protein